MNNYGFVKCAAASPKLKIANPEYNAKEMLKLILEAKNKKTQVLVFPELSLTAYTCGDLFNQKLLIDKALEELGKLMEQTKEIDTLVFIGMPILIDGNLYNCAVALQYGDIKGIVPKVCLANYNEFYEKRWFSSGKHIMGKVEEIELLSKKYPFGNLIFENNILNYRIGVEICEDLWSPIPQSAYLALNSANIIVNLSASNELVAKSDYRNGLVNHHSAATICGYVYSSAGVYESTTDVVFGGDCIICENGNFLNKSHRFKRENQIIYADIDVDRITHERRVNRTFFDQMDYENHQNYKFIKIDSQSYGYDIRDLDRDILPRPFVPINSVLVNERCEEIFNIQVAGLAKRLEHTGIEHAVIGVSGGLDSTLALLVTVQTFKLLGIPSKNILGVTMPGFGTTNHTYNSAVDLMKTMNIDIKEIDIKDACIHHFKDIGHSIENHDVIYENVQARERTQILMDLANKINGLVIGTGDLSELALGWSTYNGDHMSMYAVNCSVPKTLVKFLVEWVADNKVSHEAKNILYNIICTPISPELLPPDKNGEIVQKTEDIIGPYELHDFFLYYMIRYGIKPKKMLFISQKAFGGDYSKEQIKKYLKIFYKRFFTQQFKRSCIPDGPKVGSVSLSPRGDWRMPSDADFQIWIKEL
ncbi:MAG: NAD(+) synthase [Maledivibacter sp.]|nr:NAD(+) synthase [Maledivibacter sp.]